MTAARIEANPLGRLMYGQRELFHSNLIGWFFDQLPEAADATFRPLAAPGSDTGRWVERERGHMDLVFHWTDRAPLVIENKVFSLPHRDQLDEYASIAAKWPHRPALVLLSVSAPDFDPGEWRYLSYAEFAERILEALPADSSYEVETMRRYGALVSDLHQLVSAVDVQSDDERVWLPDSLLSAISSSQMRAALHKARAQRVARVLNAILPGLEQPAAGGMSNATPLVESFEYVYTRGMHLHLGWQLQGDQFRRAAVYHDQSISGRSQESRRLREDVSREHPEFYSFPAPLPQTLGGRKEFNHFAPSFVYKYVKTPSLTIAELRVAAASVHAEIEQFRAEGAAADRPAEATRKAP
ncbi:PD-(D/E)XK nuclease family protein [Agromyces bauzanensis]|uniref:PD-(D/E)XK nuclease family protein n=1 Tax=Agromyces bauzanensis TaxID=1308924 RepID=UPI00166DDD6C|nr:PD-(D/E)XK nuclease family protein [Agromyces bauzanensis]